MSFQLKYGGGIWLGYFSSFPSETVVHAISTRFGGVSKPPFDRLNLAMHNGDEPEDVRENRALFCRVLGLNSRDVVTAEQVHGDRILYADQSFAGRGALAYADAVRETDALFTDCKGLPLMLFFADCVPVVIVDPVKGVVGVCHAGWKGTVAKIAQKTVMAMRERCGTKAADCRVGIGPSIGGCCYEIGEDVQERFARAFPDRIAEIARPFAGKWKLDLWMANRLQLEEVGVCPEKIEMPEICTNCNSEVFYSYRADRGKTGRIAAIISLR